MTTRRAFVGHLAGLSALSGVVASTSLANEKEPSAKGRAREAGYTKIPHTDLEVSRIGYGCAELVAWDTTATSESDIDNASRVINTAYDNGITFFDHADVYASGRVESVFGEALKRTPGLRNKIVIQSKCGQILRSAGSGVSVAVNLSYDHIINSVEGSLRRLATDRLDILLLHAPDLLMQPEEVAKAFDRLHQSGKVRYFGVSNHPVARIELLRRYVRQPIVVNQIRIGLLSAGAILDGFAFTLGLTGRSGTAESDAAAFSYPGVLDYCHSTGVQIQAWSPLRGLLSAAADAKPAIQKTVQVLRQIAAEKETSPASLALAWLVRHPAQILPIASARKPEHIVDNSQAAQLTITRDEWYRLLSVASDS